MKNEKGAMIVEASFIFPLVILTVMTLLYMGLFKLQESAFLSEVQMVAIKSSNYVASPGYRAFGEWDVTKTDLSASPSEAQVTAYYKNYHDKLTVLYRELFGSGWADETMLNNKAKQLVERMSIFAGMNNLIKEEVTVKRQFLSNSIEVKTYMTIPLPGVMRVLGLQGNIRIQQGAQTIAMNPTDFIRSVDLGCDAVDAVCKELGWDGQLDKMKDGFNKIINKFL